MGGGVAGIGAVMGASHKGLNVMLLERNTFLGGAATAEYVSTRCGLFYRNESGQAEYVMQGDVKSFAEALARSSDTKPVTFGKGLLFLPYARHAFMTLADDHVQHHAKVFLEAVVHDIELSGRELQDVSATVSNHRIQIVPRAIIDCTGDALAGRLCGHGLISDAQYQAGAQVFSMTGLQGTDDRTITLQLIKAIKTGITSGKLPQECERLSLVPGTFRNGNANFKLGIPVDITDAIGNHTALQLTARSLVEIVVAYLKQATTAFSNAEITMLAPSVGIRTGLRYTGVNTLTDEDVLSCRKSDESIARGAWPIELWKVGESPNLQYFAENDFYDIPAGCLESPEYDNLWFAGRHLSATEGAVGSARVIGTAMSTGVAAGALAAAKLKGVSRSQCISEIQKQMDNDIAAPKDR
jgi:hypothetical protein